MKQLVIIFTAVITIGMVWVYLTHSPEIGQEGNSEDPNKSKTHRGQLINTLGQQPAGLTIGKEELQIVNNVNEHKPPIATRHDDLEDERNSADNEEQELLLDRLQTARSNGDFRMTLDLIAELSVIDDERAIWTLIDLAYSNDRLLAEESILALGDSGSDLAIAPLSSLLLTSSDRQLKFATIDALSEIGSENAFWELTNILYDSDKAIRVRGVDALSNFEHPEVSLFLEQALYDQDEAVTTIAKDELELNN